MQPSTTSASPSREALRAALLEYSQSPGKYQVAFRQPRLLFESLRDVLQIASGREGDEGVCEAARFFTRTALLYPGADHYALMGLDRKASAAEVKDRYRLMMRLLHPDFSGADSGEWPADAAVRVNGAYDVLSSAVQRREYDGRLAQAQSPPVAPMRAPIAEPVRPGRSPVDDSRRSRLTKIIAGCALAGAALLIVGLVATGSSDTVHLVQQRRVEAPPVLVARQESPYPTVADTRPAPSPKPIEAEVPVRSPPMPAQARPVAPTPTPTSEKVSEKVRPPAPQIVARPTPSTPAATLFLASVVPATKPTQIAEPAYSPPEVKAEAPAAVTMPAAIQTARPAQSAPLVAPPPPVQAVAATVPPVVARPAPKAGPSLMEAQPLLSQLLQQMESGRGERILNLLDAEARSKPAAQALSRQYEILIDGARPVRLSHVEFKAEPGDGRLMVVGHFRVLAGEQTIGSLGKKMVVRAEFASREGNIVITGLSGGAAN